MYSRVSYLRKMSMKKAMVFLTILLGSAAIGWGAYKTFGSATAGYIIAVIGVAAAIVPLFIKPEVEHKTVINTRGDNSPGIVRGNFVVNQTTVTQYTAAKGKTWRGLDSEIFPLLGDSETSKGRFWRCLFWTIGELFGQGTYTEFSALVNCTSEIKLGETFLVYEVMSYQPGFCPNAHRKYGRLMKLIFAWKNAGATEEGRREMDEFVRQEDSAIQGWTISYDLPGLPHWTPIQCICDPVGKRLVLAQFKTYSLDPTMYPEHVGNTKELMQFIGSYFNIEGIFCLGNSAWAINNYALMKLTVDVLSKELDPNNVRINVDDCSEWDYVNGEFDEEVRNFNRKGSGLGKAG